MKRLEKQPTATAGANERLDGLSLYSTGQMPKIAKVSITATGPRYARAVASSAE
jgi:hypothetical protein